MVGVGESERIYSSTTSVNINVDDSNKVLWIMDNATAFFLTNLQTCTILCKIAIFSSSNLLIKY